MTTEERPVERQTAYKLWIKDITNGDFVQNPVPHLIARKLDVLRINILANVVFVYQNEEKTHAYLTLDDGSDTIKIKLWGEEIEKFKDIKVGDTILVIGKVKVVNGIYVVPEIIKVVDPLWTKARHLELKKMWHEPLSEEPPRQRILKAIELLDQEEGADITKVIEETKLDEKYAEELIFELLRSGEIYEIKTGKLKVI